VIGGDPPNLDLHANSTYLVNHNLALGHNQIVQVDPKVAIETPQAIIGDFASKQEITDTASRTSSRSSRTRRSTTVRRSPRRT